MQAFRVTAAITWSALVLGLAVVGCRGEKSEEGSRLKEAVERFVDFSMSNENYNHGQRVTRSPTAKVRARRINNVMSPRLRLELEIELPHDLTGKALEQALLENARRALAGTSFQAVRVTAWPGPLKRFGGTMGHAVVAVDGRGWDGEAIGYRSVEVTLKPDHPAPNHLDFKILCALEEEVGKTKTGAPKTAGEVARAERAVAKAMGLQLQAIRLARRKAEAYYGRE